jgi:hypothetical protein
MSDEIRLVSELVPDTYKNSVGSEIAVIKHNTNVMMTAKEIAKLYGVGRPTITRHLLKLYATKKLDRKAVSSVLSHRAEDGKLYETRYYNTQAIIAIGSSLKASETNKFQKWLTIKENN